jgi:transketolase
VLHVATVKPFDADGVASFAAGFRAVVTAENHVTRGGLATQVRECLYEAGELRPLAAVGLKDSFVELGSVPTLMARNGLTAANIAARATSLLR